MMIGSRKWTSIDRMDSLEKIPAETLLKSASRELAMREHVYPRRVAEGKMPGDVADHEIACQRAIIAILKEKVREESGQLDLFDQLKRM